MNNIQYYSIKTIYILFVLIIDDPFKWVEMDIGVSAPFV